MPGTESVVKIEPKSVGIMEIREYTDFEKTESNLFLYNLLEVIRC